MNGELVGVNSAIASMGGGGPESSGAQSGSIGLGFAIPADQAKRIADELVSNGHVTHASLGVQLTQDPGAHGAAVADVVADGPAAAAGLPSGVVITKVDDRPIDGADALVAAVRSKAPGDNVTLTYMDASGAPQTVAGDARTGADVNPTAGWVRRCRRARLLVGSSLAAFVVRRSPWPTRPSAGRVPPARRPRRASSPSNAGRMDRGSTRSDRR